MNKLYISFSIILVCGMILSACSPQPPAQPAAPQAPATEVPPAAPQATEVPTTAPAAPAPTTAPAATAASTVQHTTVPSDLPTTGGIPFADNTITAQKDQQRALNGDGFTDGRMERPFNANTMDVYSPFLDITGGTIYPTDPTFVYANITFAGRDSNNAFSGKYGLELDVNLDGRGDFLILVISPSSPDWTTDGVQVFSDANHDIGGAVPYKADSSGATGDGYETNVFDSGKGSDPDTAWVRLSSTDPNSIQFAFKKSLINNKKSFMVGAWAGLDINPALFDYNDHFTHAQAGAALKSNIYYPIKAVFDMDNSCRVAVGFVS